MFKSAIIATFTALVLIVANPVLAEVSPETIDGATTISAEQAKVLFDKNVTFIDVRKDSDWDAGRVPGAHHIELKKKFTEASLAKAVDKGTEVVIYCNGEKCMRSSKACKKAVSWGYSKVYYLRHGFPSWEAAGYPVE